MRIEGEATYIDSTGKRHSIEGIGSLPDGSTLQSLKVSGIIKFDEMSCDDVQIEGDGRGKSITAKSMNVTGSVEVNTIEVENLFRCLAVSKLKISKQKISQWNHVAVL